jgi:glucose/arabinose dehydrogenase
MRGTPFQVSIVTSLLLLGPSVQGCSAQDPRCDPGNGGLELPPGFCAVVVADSIGRGRHLVVAPNGDILVALRRGRGEGENGGLLALRDNDGDGRADVMERFGESSATGISLRDGFIYFAPDDAVLRYPFDPGTLGPAGPPDTIVSGFPSQGRHAAKSALVDSDGSLFVNVGGPSNVCEVEGSTGKDPCPQLERQGGIWRFEAGRIGQTQADGERYATGLRNTFAVTIDPSGQLFGVQHGRDRLHQSWPALFTEEQGANKPSEELVRIERGDDFGWPYCYHDPELDRLVLAPEYGGDGEQSGLCAEKKGPEFAFPAHWAPEAIVFYTADQFPAKYRNGAFISFHGAAGGRVPGVRRWLRRPRGQPSGCPAPPNRAGRGARRVALHRRRQGWPHLAGDLRRRVEGRRRSRIPSEELAGQEGVWSAGR